MWPIGKNQTESELSHCQRQRFSSETVLQREKNLHQQVCEQLKQQLNKIKIEALEKQKNFVEQQIDLRRRQFEKLKQMNANQIKKLKDQMIQERVDDIKKRIEKAKATCEKAKAGLQRAVDFIEKVKEGIATVEKAMAAARGAIIAAGLIPSGVITGMANGLLSAKPKSLMEAAKTGMELIEFAQKSLLTMENVYDRVEMARAKVDAFREKLGTLKMEEWKATIQHEIDKEMELWRKKKDNFEEYVGEKKGKIEQLLNGISQLQRQTTQLGRNALQLKVEQRQLQVKEAEIACDIAQSKYQRQSYVAADLFFRLCGVIDEIKRINANITAVAKRIAEVRADRKQIQLQPLAKQVSPLLQLLLRQIDQIKTKIDQEQKAKSPTPACPEIQDIAYGRSILDLTDAYHLKLEEANRLLFKYANWLYFISGDSALLDWALFCKDHCELGAGQKLFGQKIRGFDA